MTLLRNIGHLHFQDGTKFRGELLFFTKNIEIERGILGEACFLTSLSGYEQSITDPSFLGQHLVFTHPHIGNYKINEKFLQSLSGKSHISSFICRELTWQKQFEIWEKPILTRVDTRSLTQYLRNSPKSDRGILSLSDKTPDKLEFRRPLRVQNLHEVSGKMPFIKRPDQQSEVKIEENLVILNYGIKKNIYESLQDLGKNMVMLDHTATCEEILSYRPTLVFLSSGPGDPRKYTPQIKVIKELIHQKIPLRGICLGYQLIGLALGLECEKLPFGHRGSNHPVFDHIKNKVVITSQNHGYHLKWPLSQNKNLEITHSSLFDHSLEGFRSHDRLISCVQFHPEANPGPHDTLEFFQELFQSLPSVDKKQTILSSDSITVTKTPDHFSLKDLASQKTTFPYRKILVIGSGPIRIGQAQEFDYSGTQACEVLKSLGIESVLINSNPATIMTDQNFADHTYIGPITIDQVKKVILKERVDAILSTMGGQTALNISLQLEQEGFLKKERITLLGATGSTIKMAEDRHYFSTILSELGYKSCERKSCHSREEAIKNLDFIGLPLLIRQDFCLGGQGATTIENRESFEIYLKQVPDYPITLEKSLHGFKEVELEVMVDSDKNGVIICSIENIDPCGIHTGDSITVAPAQTISDHCLQKMRNMSLSLAKRLNVVAGGANVQFAINPKDDNDIYIIEMNPRVSRSSALASKATGYAIAKISTLLALGLKLTEITNDITLASPVSFEPTLDYIALKIPVFPFHKFPESSKILGPQMRAVGEVLALGANFQEAFLKALRSLEAGFEMTHKSFSKDDLEKPKELSLLTVLEAIRCGYKVSELHEKTKISPWFLEQMAKIVDLEDSLLKQKSTFLSQADSNLWKYYKSYGLSDKKMAQILETTEEDILKRRWDLDVHPAFKAVDTCSGEFLASTPYFYSTYLEKQEMAPLENALVILGSGPNRIGQGIEFDYSCVKAAMAVREKGKKAILINSNPETVSTDYDHSNRLYLAPLYSEDLLEILYFEKNPDIIAAYSGQTGILLRRHFEESFYKKFISPKFLGASKQAMATTEDRSLFDKILEKLPISKTKTSIASGFSQLKDKIDFLGYPVIIRPSYVIGGESMFILRTDNDFEKIPEELASTTFQVENFLENAIEYDVDLIRDKEGNHIFAITEHIEHAGVHSGDSGMVTPAIHLTANQYEELKTISKKMANTLQIVGPINIQFALKEGKFYCIEANPRGSRTLPFLSKAYSIPLPELGTWAMMGEIITPWDRNDFPYFSVKQSTFPFDRFEGDNLILGPRMRSTGETMGQDQQFHKALIKSLLGNFPDLNKKGKILFSIADHQKPILLPYLHGLFEQGHQFYATPGTREYIFKQGYPCHVVSKIGKEKTDLHNLIQDQELRMILNIPQGSFHSQSDGQSIRKWATTSSVPCFTRTEAIRSILTGIISTSNEELMPYSLQEIHSVPMATQYPVLQKIIVALDDMSNEEIFSFLDQVKGVFTHIKLGLDTFLRYGRSFFDELHKRYQLRLFLDFKLHDIPDVVARTIESLQGLPIDYLTLQLLGGRTMIEKAKLQARLSLPETELVGVSYLTSLGDKDFKELWNIKDREELKAHFQRAFNLSAEYGLKGLLLSPDELQWIPQSSERAQKIKSFCVGLRFHDDGHHDQRRVSTPQMAIEANADYLIMGRSLTKAYNLDERIHLLTTL